MKSWRMVILGLVAISAKAADPFGVSFSESDAGTSHVIKVALAIPANHHVFADQVWLEGPDGVKLRQVGGAGPVRVHDPFSDSDRSAFTNNVELVYETGAAGGTVAFSYQGCSEQECFFPQTRTYGLQGGLGPKVNSPEPGMSLSRSERGWQDTALSHHVAGRASGYLGASDFLSFLDRAEGRDTQPGNATVSGRIKAGFFLFSDDPAGFLKVHGILWTLLLILFGGLLLNLTPCVLPMIPINLAILGVGSQDSTRLKGFLLGAAYGGGMAFVYGILGLVVILTGAQFGTLNSMPWFNLLIAILFVLLALAMFDVFTIDFTRFQRVGDGQEAKRGRITTAFVVGGIAALLAGACVAPVVIAVLLLSGNLYAHGVAFGLALPFVLGLGMALPWPFAGAGLTFLPKPGSWMTWVKYGFGVFILLFSVYYFALAYRGWVGKTTVPETRSGVDGITVKDRDRWFEILRESEASGKPVFVDFWATWCKNCEAMEVTTFKDEGVRKRLASYRVVKFQVETLTDPEARAVTEHFEIKGLPTYLVLSPGKKR